MKYTQAPLPFTGQKRNFLSSFKEILSENIPNDGAGWTIVDVFGGSGLLAHTAKRCKPQARVIYNDFDNYAVRLQHIDDTNRLRRQIADYLTAANIPRESKLSDKVKSEIIQMIQSFDGFKDMRCLASWLLFSGNQARNLDDLFRKSWYYSIRMSDYPSAVGYLAGVEIVQINAHDLIPQYIDNPKVLLVLDPPYICTEQGSYNNDTYFGMVEFLKLMAITRPPFVFFSSTKSELIDYLDFLRDFRQPEWERFKDYQKISIKTNMNYAARYEDNLIFKF